MSSRSQLPPAVEAVAETALSLVRRAPSARVAIARLGALVDPATVPPRARDEVVAELEAAREAACVPLAADEIERALRDAWKRPPAKVLDDLDTGEPIAITPASVVLRGELDGDAVAVKVRRPGLERAVRNDLALLDVLVPPLRAAFPRLDAGAVLRDVREQALDELDYEHEASQQRRVARALRRVDGVRVPRADLELSTPGVLVSELLAGTTLAAGAAPGDAEAAARALVEAHRAAVFEAGLAPVDPRPSHVVVDGDTIGLLGLGVARPVDKKRAETALQSLRALASGSGEFASTVAGSGLLDEEVAGEAEPLLRAVLAGLVDGPARLDADALRALAERAAGATPALARVAMAAAPQPADLALGRMLGQLVGVLGRLGAREDWVALV